MTIGDHAANCSIKTIICWMTNKRSIIYTRKSALSPKIGSPRPSHVFLHTIPTYAPARLLLTDTASSQRGRFRCGAYGLPIQPADHYNGTASPRRAGARAPPANWPTTSPAAQAGPAPALALSRGSLRARAVSRHPERYRRGVVCAPCS